MSDNVEPENVASHDALSEPEGLEDSDLEAVAGGGVFMDVYDALNDAWTDIKKGFVDAMND